MIDTIKRRAIIASMIFLVLAGCGERSAPEVRDPVPAAKAPESKCELLAFDQVARDEGAVSAGKPLRATFPFTVSSDSPVTITAISRSCECMLLDTALIGKRLEPGSRHRVSLSVDTYRRFGPVGGTAIVSTSPSCEAAIELNVSGFVECPPKLVQATPVRVSASFESSARFQVHVESRRLPEDPEFHWDESRSRITPMTVERYEADSQRTGRIGGMRKDSVRTLHSWSLSSPLGLAVGQFDYDLVFAWKDGGEVHVPIVATVEHPLRLSLERVFFGEMSPGEEKTVFVYIRSQPTVDTSMLVAECDVADVLVDTLVEPPAIRLRATAPKQASGRFAGTLRIDLPTGDWPQLELPISGIVRSANASD